MKTRALLLLTMLFCILEPPLFGVSKEQSSLDSLPLSKMVRKKAPKKLAADKALFSSYIKQEKNFPLHQKKEAYRQVPKFPLHLEDNLEFSLASKCARKKVVTLKKTPPTKRVSYFLDPEFVAKILQGPPPPENYLSPLLEAATLTTAELSIAQIQNSPAPHAPSLYKKKYQAIKAPPISCEKTKFLSKSHSMKKKEVRETSLVEVIGASAAASSEQASYESDSEVEITLEQSRSNYFEPSDLSSSSTLLSIENAPPEKELLFTTEASVAFKEPVEKKELLYKKEEQQFAPHSLEVKENSAPLPTLSLKKEQVKAPSLSPNLKKVQLASVAKNKSGVEKYLFFEEDLECTIKDPNNLVPQKLVQAFAAQSFPGKEQVGLPISLNSLSTNILATKYVAHRLPIHLKATSFAKEFFTKPRAFFTEGVDFQPFSHFHLLQGQTNLTNLGTDRVEEKNTNTHFALVKESKSAPEKVCTSFPRSEKVESLAPNFPITGAVKTCPSNISSLKLPRKVSEEQPFEEPSYPAFFQEIPQEVAVQKVFIARPKENFFGTKEETHKHKNIALSPLRGGQSLTSYQKTRPFKATVNNPSFAREIVQTEEPVEASKSSLETIISEKIPSKAFAQKKMAIHSPSSMFASKPMPLDRISLSEKLPLREASLSQAISLPALSTKKQATFAMHPMLSLLPFSSNLMEEEAKFVAIETNRSFRMTGYNLFNWPTLDDLSTLSLSDSFYLDTRLLDSELSDGVEFACTIRSSEKNLLPPLPVQILYLLDASSSIESHRFNLFKKAILDSLDYLERSATFNIAVISKGKITKLRERNISPTKSGKSYAKRFLRKIEQSSTPTFNEIASVIAKEKTLAKKNNYHRCCLLLSDGKFTKNVRVDSHPLKTLEEEEVGNFSLYTATASDNNNKQMLTLLARLNHGFSLFTRTHASFPRKFSMLVKRIKEPTLHDITITFPDTESAITFNEGSIAPILHTGKNLTLFGSIPQKDGGRIFIQGRSGNKWVNIVKELPLQESRKGKYGLHKKLATQKTLFAIRSFLQSGEEAHLTDAKKYSEEYDLPNLFD